MLHRRIERFRRCLLGSAVACAVGVSTSPAQAAVKTGSAAAADRIEAAADGIEEAADSQADAAQPQAGAREDAQPGNAGAETSDEREGIVITATRRSTLLDETPLSISVVSAETLERDNINSIVDLNGRLPSLVIGQSFGGSRIAIRGVGFNPIRPGDEGRVAFYTDGVYIARPSAQIGTLFDVARIEVLRGPQGTLYGRNATGGALLVVTRDPTRETSGYLDATIGSFGSREFQGALSSGLTEGVSARVAFQTINRNGYYDNIQTGNDVGDAQTVSLRGTLLIQPTERLTVRLTADSHREDDRNYVVHPIRRGFVNDPFALLVGSRDVSQPFDPKNEVDSWGLSASATWELTDQLTFSGVGGYRDIDTDLLLNASGVSASRSNFQDHSKQYTGELQLSGDHRVFDWIVGVSYFYEDQNPSLRSAILGRAFFPAAPNFLVQGTNSTANLITDAYAVFGEVTANLTEQLSITAGIRYTKEQKDSRNEFASLDLFTPYPAPTSNDNGFILRPPRAGFPRNSSIDFDSFTPRVAVNYEFTPDISGYLTYVEGFKSGGFNYGTIQDPYEPETIQNYEAGLRARLFGRALTLRGAVFRYDYKKLQQTVQLPNIVGTFVLNTADARIEGAELEFIVRPIPKFQIDGNFAYLDAEFGSFVAVDPNRNATVDIGGNRVPQAPDYTLLVGAQYDLNLAGGTLSLRGEYQRTGETYFDIFNNEPVRQGAYGVVNANISYEAPGGNWHARLFAQNLGNTYAANSLAIQANALGGGVTGNLIAPRRFGLTVGYRF